MENKHKHALPLSAQKKHIAHADIQSAFETQAISDTSRRQPKTGVAIPRDECVEDGKDWVDSNEK